MLFLCIQKLYQLVKNVEWLLGSFLRTIHEISSLGGCKVPLDIMLMMEGKFDQFHCVEICVFRL